MSTAAYVYPEYRCPVVSAPASYLGDPGFKSRPGEPDLSFFVVLLGASKQMA